MSEILIDAAGIAGLFNRSIDWWYRNRRRLEAKGFPPPVTHGRWHRPSIDAWFRRRSELDRIRAAEPELQIVVQRDDDGDPTPELAARARKIAGGMR